MSQSKARATRKASLRDQLAKKRAKVVVEYFPLDDEGEKAIERLEEAQKLLANGKRIAALQQDKSTIDITALERDVAAAEAERDKHCLALRMRGLSEDERDALQSSFPVEDPPQIPDNTPEEKRRELEEKVKAVEAANKASTQEWTYHALAAAVQESDLTADEWRDELTSGRWTAGDLHTLRKAIIRATNSQPAEGIPKG